ncbi:MAG: RdgB/HAM1 family non-canonical purine NTP pyrophosphatase [Clostridiales bacterium]|nr:RdgB/HAM1 family non-canonical purine NTP pyrophosphatase [Clostridiales bacterium]
MELKRIAVATSNKGKLKEIRNIFKGVELVSMQELGFCDEIEETGKTFRANAKIKAEVIAKKYNIPTLADDSGLCVDGLCGAPGIYSARFSGEGEAANRKLLLKRMEQIDNRKAHFECAVCLCLPDGHTYFGEGKTHGRILFEETGTGGFGYDSLFFSDDLQKSFGLATEEEKNSVSHRFRALEDLKKKI